MDLNNGFQLFLALHIYGQFKFRGCPMLSRLLKNRSGNFGILAALLIVPVFGAAGLALDYSNAIAVKAQIQGAADAAALAAVSEKSIGVQTALEMSGDGEISLAKADAISFFKAQLENDTGFTVDEIDAKVVKKDGLLYSVVNYKVTVPTTLSRVLGKELIQVAGQSTVEYQIEL
ncbi:MAG: pilus assembly protein TadG-related protein, partial [Hoeflea sp.]|nr:pilus assembly protein TadG-related protein [Hoeflea sp.]